MAEIKDLKVYLSKTPVCWLIDKIARGAKVSRGEITPLSEIGTLKTIWGNIGGIQSINEHAAEKFLVRQVIQALKDPRCTDKNRLSLIEKYKQLFANGKLELIITLLEHKSNISICDGNTRVVACFEHGSETRQVNLSLPVYVITQDAE
jgi:hypothetical protein